MSYLETKGAEPASGEEASKELSQYLEGASIGSAKLLAYNDELRDRELRGLIGLTSGSKKKVDIENLNFAQMQLALLRHQAMNKTVEMKGYAKASWEISQILSRVERAYRIEAMQKGKSSEKEIGSYLDNTYSSMVYSLLNALTSEDQSSQE